MSQIHIENVPDNIIDLLESRATANNRSLSQEVLAIVEAALPMRRVNRAEALARLDRLHAAMPKLKLEPAEIDAAKRWGRE